MTIKSGGGNSNSEGGRGKILNIRLSGDTGVHIPVELNGVRCLALIDTGASRSCMSSTQYKLVGSPLEPLPPGARLRSVTGTSMEAWGLTSCLVRIGQKVYAQSFIVCNKMMTNVIVGRDFLSTYKLNITWGDEGTMEVLEGQNLSFGWGKCTNTRPMWRVEYECPTHSGRCPHSCESPTFRKENTFSFHSIKRKLGFTDELFSVPFGLRYLEGWPPTHHTNNNQFSRGASDTGGRDITRVL